MNKITVYRNPDQVMRLAAKKQNEVVLPGGQSTVNLYNREGLDLIVFHSNNKKPILWCERVVEAIVFTRGLPSSGATGPDPECVVVLGKCLACGVLS